MNDNESDEDYREHDGPLSDGESVPGTKAEVIDSESDEEESAFNTKYGNLKKISGRYVAVVMEELGLEVSVKEHQKICGCNLDDEDAVHYLKDAADNDDTDSGAEDLDDVDKDAVDEVVEGGAMNDEEAEDIDEGYEEGDIEG
jgi:hypothetical protein